MNTTPGPSAQILSKEPHEMRITDHGKIHSFVSFALSFLQENPERPLVFHTFPSTKTKAPIPRPDEQAHAEPSLTANPEPYPAANPETPVDESPKKKRKLPAPTATIPRLVSVVEIVKREYGKWVATRRAPDGELADDSLRTGLHQYNELACLEDLGIVELQPPEQGPDDAEQLRIALEGKNFLKQKFTPHLKVTLSVRALPDLEKKGATHQPPLPVTKSKSARARERKRLKKKKTMEVDG